MTGHRRFKGKVPQECFTSSMTISVSYLWRPNNYRRQIAVKQKQLSTIQKIKATILYRVKLVPHTQLLFIKDYKGVTIQYGKDTLTAIYSQPVRNKQKQTYLIKGRSIEEVNQKINKKKTEIKDLLDNALISFIKQFDIKKRFARAKWSRHEDWIKGEEYIDKLPRDLIIHDTVFKKVYGEGIEFTGYKNDDPTAKVKTYIKNRAIENIAPEISSALGKIENGFTSFTKETLPILSEFSENIKSHTTVIKGMVKGFNKFNKLLSKLDKKLDKIK